jgi:hypothetical protein
MEVFKDNAKKQNVAWYNFVGLQSITLLDESMVKLQICYKVW